MGRVKSGIRGLQRGWVQGRTEKEDEWEGSNDAGGGFCGALLWHCIQDNWLPVSNTICWVCGGVPIGSETIRAIEYLKEDFKLYDGVWLEDDVRAEKRDAEDRESPERGRVVRGKERE